MYRLPDNSKLKMEVKDTCKKVASMQLFPVELSLRREKIRLDLDKSDLQTSLDEAKAQSSKCIGSS